MYRNQFQKQQAQVQAQLFAVQPMPVLAPTPAQGLELTEQMRGLFEARWVRWHRCKCFEDAVADPLTRRLLELAVAHKARHVVQHGKGRR